MSTNRKKKQFSPPCVPRALEAECSWVTWGDRSIHLEEKWILFYSISIRWLLHPANKEMIILISLNYESMKKTCVNNIRSPLAITTQSDLWLWGTEYEALRWSNILCADLIMTIRADSHVSFCSWSNKPEWVIDWIKSRKDWFLRQLNENGFICVNRFWREKYIPCCVQALALIWPAV